VIKPGKKAPNPILHEIRGFKYTHNQRAVFFGYRKPVFFFRIFFSVGNLFDRSAVFKAFLEAPRRAEKHVLFSSALAVAYDYSQKSKMPIMKTQLM
jgi:hypothetical protein